MFPAVNSEQPVIAALAEFPAHWEERSARRVPDAAREQVLERSRKIVDAACDVLEEEGLEGLTVRAVLNKTGLSRRAFYERFEGKDDLVLAVFEQTIRAATIHFGKLISTLAAPIERLELIVTHIVLGRTSLALADHASSNRRGAAMSREHLRMAAGSVRSGNPQRLATLVYNLVSITVHIELLSQGDAQPDRAHRAQLAADIWEFCRRAIVA